MAAGSTARGASMHVTPGTDSTATPAARQDGTTTQICPTPVTTASRRVRLEKGNRATDAQRGDINCAEASR